MADYITKIRTEEGDKQIDFNALANLPVKLAATTATTTTLGSGTIASGTTSTTAINTGVLYDVIREYDMFEICMRGSSDTGDWTMYPTGGNDALWARIAWGAGRSKVVFEKVVGGVYKVYFRNTVNTDAIGIGGSAPYLTTAPMSMSLSYLLGLDSYYLGKTITIKSKTDTNADIGWVITGIKFE